MCYTIPGKLIEIKGNIGVVDYFGEKRDAAIDFSDVKVGDYVYAQGGLVINKIQEKQALKILDGWKEFFFELKKIDAKLSGVSHDLPPKNRVSEVLARVNQNKQLKKEDLLELLKINDADELKFLYEAANNIRQARHGNASCVHGIIEFSNYCENNCFYCGIRDERRIPRYRMGIDEIVGVAKYAVKNLNFKALVLQSGEDYWYDEKKLAALVKELRKLHILIFLSIGERDKDTYKKLFVAGARGALLRFETSNKDIFRIFKPDSSLDKRLHLIRELKKIGYVLAAGFMAGLPQETDKDIVNNIILTKSLKPDMYSFGPFLPVKGTPLANEGAIDKDKILKIISLCRIADQDSNILVTTALKTLNPNAEKEGLLAGANSLMINITPKKYRALYRIYDNRWGSDKNIKDDIKDTVDMLYSLGRAPTDIGARF